MRSFAVKNVNKKLGIVFRALKDTSIVCISQENKMETGNHRIVLFSNSLIVVGCDGPKWKIIEEKELADGLVGVVLYRPYHRIRGGGMIEKIRAEYALGKIDGFAPNNSTVTILRTVQSGRQHRTALKGFLNLLHQMR